jgi:hypothetical protein
MAVASRQNFRESESKTQTISFPTNRSCFFGYPLLLCLQRRLKFIPEFPDGVKIARILRVGFDFVPQRRYTSVHAPRQNHTRWV